MKYPSITELVLRDGQQSLIATRMRLSDMMPILSKLDNIGFSSLEMWGGATYDCCLRFLNDQALVGLGQYLIYALIHL